MNHTVQILKHYIMLLLEDSGVRTDNDTHADLDSALNELVTLKKQMNELQEKVAHLEKAKTPRSRTTE
jgi:hypothetical protein